MFRTFAFESHVRVTCRLARHTIWSKTTWTSIVLFDEKETCRLDECIAQSQLFTRVALKFTAQSQILPVFAGKIQQKFFWKNWWSTRKTGRLGKPGNRGLLIVVILQLTFQAGVTTWLTMVLRRSARSQGQR